MEKYVIYADWIKYGMPREPYEFALKLEKCGWTLIPCTKLDINFFKEKSCVIFCITYIELDISSLKHSNNKLLYKIDDLFPYFEMSKKCVDAADFIIGPYTYLFNELNDSIIQTKPNLWLPYSAVPEYYEQVEYNNTPKIKVFVSGAIGKVYHLRSFIAKDKNFADKIEKLDHPGYIQSASGFKHNIVRGDYYKKLNEYICCFCDCLIYKYVLAKIFEITSVGSLLLVEDKIETQLNLLGFYDTINCIMCNQDNLLEKIEWIFSPENRITVDNIRIKGMKLTRQMHNTDNRIEKFNLFFNNITL
jgi:hypothetical protein